MKNRKKEIKLFTSVFGRNFFVCFTPIDQRQSRLWSNSLEIVLQNISTSFFPPNILDICRNVFSPLFYIYDGIRTGEGLKCVL